MNDEVRVELLNRTSELPRLADAVESFCSSRGLGKSLRYAVNLVLEELLLNIISYAYDDKLDHVIRVGMSAVETGDEKEVTLSLEDDGKSFDPFSVPYDPPKDISLDNAEYICLGIFLIRMLTDSQRYERKDGRNTLVLKIIERPGKQTLASMMTEKRTFQPPAMFRSDARISSMDDYRSLYRRSIEEPESFWAERAEDLHWFKKWEKVLVEDFMEGKHEWFVGGKINVAFNCLDRHLPTWRKNKAAIIWEGDQPGEQKTFTYQQLHRLVCRFANVLKKHGVRKGDRVTLYLPMVPELAVAVLACARIGAIHSVVFGGFSAESLRDRILDCDSTLLICADGYYRGGRVMPSKANADKALSGPTRVGRVIVVQRVGTQVEMIAGRDHWWDEEISAADIADTCEAEPMDAEDPLFILYTSGSTGKPKGVLHTTAGYLLYVNQTFKYIFDIRDEDTYWCTADIGWVTGHSYIVYGPLSNGATCLMYEGVPGYPAPDRFWDIVERHRVSIFYTAPTALRALIREGEQWPDRHDLSSLRLLGTVGEPINPEAWMWYHRVIGKGRCPIIDTWWQTETGGVLISPMPGATATKPGSATFPFFGIQPAVIRENMSDAPRDEGGWLVIRRPWPGLMRRVYGDPERFKKTYFAQFPGVYTTGDGARVDEDGYFWLLGRIDDVINVSGHRLGTAEVESALVSHHAVAEAAVVGTPHEVKGQAIYAFVTTKSGATPSSVLATELREHVRREIGPIATPEVIQFAEALPKTRSGKIMRRILTKIARGDTSNLGDTTTLLDPSVVDTLIRTRPGEPRVQ
ncbi:MAG: acetate--CoA ligase [Acidobacteriota bacterium]